jgi:hypothetical protein
MSNTKKVVVRNQNNESLFELTSEELDDLNKSFDMLTEFSKNNWIIKIVELNYQTLMNTTDEIFSILSKSFPNTWFELEQASIEFNRHFLNYLSSMNTFLDQQSKFLSNYFGKDSDELKQFKDKTTDFFDNHFAYRLLYKIRNYTVHCGFSILSIKSSQEIVNNGTTKRITYIPYFLREELLNNFDFGSVLKPELKKMDGNIKVYDLVNKSISLYQELDEIVIKLIKSDKEKHILKVKSILKINDNHNKDFHLLISNGESLKLSNIPYHYLE